MLDGAVAHRRGALVLAALLALHASPASAYVVSIAPGTRAIYLQVGTGTFTGTYASGGVPGNNTTVNTVSVSVAPAALGTGSVAMTSNSVVSNSSYDNRAFCTPPAQVYVGGFYRVPLTGGNARLTVTTPTALLNAAGDAIPFTQISWTSGGSGDATPTIPSGTFTGGAQRLLTVTRNQWFESCLSFRYANGTIVPAGTFTGRATYTLTAP